MSEVAGHIEGAVGINTEEANCVVVVVLVVVLAVEVDTGVFVPGAGEFFARTFFTIS